MKQPNALRLAAALNSESERVSAGVKYSTARQSSKEIVRLHEANQAMLHGLRAIKERLETSPTYVMLASEVFDSFYQQIIDEAIAKGEQA